MPSQKRSEAHWQRVCPKPLLQYPRIDYKTRISKRNCICKRFWPIANRLRQLNTLAFDSEQFS